MGDKRNRACKICVIGGGIAGVNCARKLILSGFHNIKVFEAQDKIGGRISTYYGSDSKEDPYKFEYGANWIHGINGNPIYEIVKRENLQNKIPCISKRGYRSRRKVLTERGDEVDKKLYALVNGIYWELYEKANTFFSSKLPQGYSSKSSFEEFIIKEGLAELKAEQEVLKNEQDVNNELLKRDLLNYRLSYETYISGCHSMSEVSLKQFGSYGTIPGGDIVIGQGYVKVVESLAENIPDSHIFLNTAVTAITWKESSNDKQCNMNLLCCMNGESNISEQLKQSSVIKTDPSKCNGKTQPNSLKSDSMHTEPSHSDSTNKDTSIKVTLSDGSSHYFDHVIFTGSLGHLKHYHQTLFQPELPKKKITAINRLGIGTVDKIFVEFENLDFLGENTHSIVFCWSEVKTSNEVQDWTKKLVTMNVVDKPKANMVMFWVTGLDAEAMERLSEEDVGKDIVQVLAMFLKKPDIPQPTRVIRSNWGTNKYFHGSYSYIAVGATVEDVKNLAEPVYGCNSKPILQFCGEATHEKYYSTTHGAFLTGEREADRLISYYS